MYIKKIMTITREYLSMFTSEADFRCVVLGPTKNEFNKKD